MLMCLCYVLGQLYFRISGFNLKKEAVYFRNVADSVKYFFLRQWGKKNPVSASDTTFVIALSKICMLQLNGKFGCWCTDVSVC
jgi:hypothetical protein